jgi:sulfate adenylyltransferase
MPIDDFPFFCFSILRLNNHFDVCTRPAVVETISLLETFCFNVLNVSEIGMMEQKPTIISPYGGRLVDLSVSEEESQELIEKAGYLPSIRLSHRGMCDLELLATGAFSPLDRFMGSKDYDRVLAEMRLTNGLIFPIPITLSVSSPSEAPVGQDITLRDPKNEIVALMNVEEIFARNLELEARLVLGTVDPRHPLVAEMLTSWSKWCVSGDLQIVRLPRHYDFTDLYRTPKATRRALQQMGRSHVVAFQTRNPMHRVHEEMVKSAANTLGATALIHPVVGMTQPGDIDHFTRVRCYKVLVERYFDPSSTLLALFPLAMRMAGPREAVWHAIIRRNYGASHLIVGRDHASPGRDGRGQPFYDPYEAQHLLASMQQEIGVGVVPFDELVYLPDKDCYEEKSHLPKDQRFYQISGTEVRTRYLPNGELLPSWFTRPEVARILCDAYPPRYRRGFCVWFTGLPSAGKSTIAEILTFLLMERGLRITLLDGDVVRTHLSKGLGFTKEDRDTNILRIGFVAAEILKHHGVAICAAVSPYRVARNQVRTMVGDDRFVLVYVKTPLEICEQRDSKMLYAQARRGEIKGMTGIDDPYEEPIAPEIVLETVGHAPEHNAQEVLEYLVGRGFIPND